MESFLTLMESSQQQLRQSTALDPDGYVVRQALLLVARAAAAADAAPPAESVAWDLFSAAAGAAVAELQADLPDPALLPDDLRPGRDSGEDLRAATAALTVSLADLYAAAAASDVASPWRRLVWATVALHLDIAAARLR
jgi:hypothetical protein